MKTKLTILKVLCCYFFIVGSFFKSTAQNKPFPQQKDWNGCIKPSNVSQQQMNTSVQNMYNYWKSNFLKPTNLSGGYYIKGGCTGCSVPSKGTSEGHGYGMIITALMGGYDAQAKAYFDGLYKFFDTHRSTINSELMGWNVAVDERTNAFSSAADGDMDIAYALLLAHYQWGSSGSINYLQEAKDMITTGVKASLIHPSSLRVMMGDWDNNALETRSSDWMTAHFRAYQKATGDNSWNNVANMVYQMVDQLNTNNLGILPDFVDGIPARPDANNATGEPNSQDYYWNACRTPLRIATDFAHYGTQAARTQSNRFVNWAKTDIGTNFENFASGYAVNGQVVGSRYGPSAFVAPLVTAAITNNSNQSFLNAGWNYIKNKQTDYYGTSINLLSMLVISGNWWIPEPGDVTPPSQQQSPYAGIPWGIPGKIEAENYDIGGQNIAFKDITNTNQGGAYRNDNVDIETSSEGGYNVGWIKSGEWLEYTVNVIVSNTYTVESRVAATNIGKSFHIELDGQNVSGQINIPNTGGWQNWETVTTSIFLSEGEKVMRIVMDSNDFNLDHLIFRNTTTPNQPPTVSLTSPISGSEYTVGQTVNINANASDIDGTIKQVEFLLDGNLVATDDSSPYSINWSAVQGNYTISAIAIDNDNAKTSSSTSSVIVNTDTGGGICNVAQYIDGSAYKTGDEVQNLGKKYECLVGGWCSIGGPYAPGDPNGWAWPNAWREIGSCVTTFALSEDKMESLSAPCGAAQYVNGNTYQTGEEVHNLGKKYKCLVGGWCSLGGVYSPGGPDDWAWPSAWEDLGICDGDGVNELPMVNITSPSDGEQFLSGDIIKIEANATDIDGTITSVTFLMDEVEIGIDTDQPFELEFSPVDGDHTLVVVATDNQGGTTRSRTIDISIEGETGDEGCTTVVYVNGNTYHTGDEVQNLGKKYRCKVGGWCSAGGAYTPGGPDDWAWPLAWEELGPCSGGNTPPDVTILIPTIVYADALPVTVPFKVRVTDPDGIQLPVYVNVPGGALPLLPQGDDVYEADWSFSEYKTYSYTGMAIDKKDKVNQFSFEITIKERVQGGDFLISKQEYNDLFPYRYGVDLTTYEIDPAKDFFTYEAFVESIERMKNIEVTFERRKGTNLYRLTRKDKQTNQSKVIRTDPDFDADWNQSKPIIIQVVDYGMFSNQGSEIIRKRELAAFFANIAQETTGGWDTAPGGRYAWGLHFREEVNPASPYVVGSSLYPAVQGKSYHGRGPMQISYNYNYGQLSEFIFGDKNVLLNNPEMLTQDGALAFQAAIWFWMTPQYPKPSAHDVMVGNWTPSSYDLERNRKPGLGMTINIINGGVECGEGYEELKPTHRIGHYKKFTGIFNVSTDLDNDDCSECGCAIMEPFSGIEPEDIELHTIMNNALSSLQIELSPNPFKNQLYINFGTDLETKALIRIIDFTGQDVINSSVHTLKKGKLEIMKDVSGLPSGMYFLKMRIGNEVKTFKIVKQ